MFHGERIRILYVFDTLLVLKDDRTYIYTESEKETVQIWPGKNGGARVHHGKSRRWASEMIGRMKVLSPGGIGWVRRKHPRRFSVPMSNTIDA